MVLLLIIACGLIVGGIALANYTDAISLFASFFGVGLLMYTLVMIPVSVNNEIKVYEIEHTDNISFVDLGDDIIWKRTIDWYRADSVEITIVNTVTGMAKLHSTKRTDRLIKKDKE